MRPCRSRRSGVTGLTRPTVAGGALLLLVTACSINGFTGGADDAGARPDGGCTTGALACAGDQPRECVAGVWLDNGAACGGGTPTCLDGACRAAHDAGPPAFVQSTENNDTSGGLDMQLSAPAFDRSVTAGDMLLVAVSYSPMNEVSGGDVVKLTVEDTQGNAFQELADSFDEDKGDGLRTFYTAAAKGGVDDVLVVQVGSPACHYVMLYAAEYSGVHEVVAHDMIVQPSAPTTTDGVTVALATASSGTLIWAFAATTSQTQAFFDAGTGFTARGPKLGSWPFGTSDGKPQVVARAEDRPAGTGSQLAEASWTLGTSDDTINTIALLR